MAIAGKSGGAYIGANKIAEIKNFSIELAADDIDITNLDSSGWKEFLAGIKEWSGSIEGNFKTADTNGQALLYSAWTNGTVVALVLKLSAAQNLAGNAFVSNIAFDVAVEDEVQVSFDFTGSGAVTPTL